MTLSPIYKHLIHQILHSTKCETATANFHSVSLLKEKRSDEEDEDDDMQKLFKFLSFTLMIDIPERKVQVRVSF